MVNLEFEKQEILRKHQKEYDGGNKIFIGSTDKVPKKLTVNMILNNPDVLRKSKNPFPFKGEILDAPNMPDIVKEITDITLKKVKKTEKLAEKPKEGVKTERPKNKFYTKKELEAFNFNKLKIIGKKLGTTDRSRKNLIKEILKLQ